MDTQLLHAFEMNERKYYSLQENVKIVLNGLSGTIQVSELSRKYEIKPAGFYSWKKKLLKNSLSTFNERSRKKSKFEDVKEVQNKEIARLKDTIAEITTENLQLK